MAFTIGKSFLADYSATVGLILVIFSADPHELSIKKIFFLLGVTRAWRSNFPIIILNLLNGFHKFTISMEPNTSELISKYSHTQQILRYLAIRNTLTLRNTKILSIAHCLFPGSQNSCPVSHWWLMWGWLTAAIVKNIQVDFK